MGWCVRCRSLWECLGHAACGGPTLLIRFTENPPHPVGLGHNNLVLLAEQSATGKHCFILLSIYTRLANKLSPTLCRWVHQGELVIDDHDSRSCIRPLEILNSCFRINKHSLVQKETYECVCFAVKTGNYDCRDAGSWITDCKTPSRHNTLAMIDYFNRSVGKGSDFFN